MNILIIGATRGIGFQLLEHALMDGHTVTALVRDSKKLVKENEQLKVIKGDILDLSSMQQAITGQDAVCSCIGINPMIIGNFANLTYVWLQTRISRG